MIIQKTTVGMIVEMGYTAKYLDPEANSAFEAERAFLNLPELEDGTPVAFFKPDGTEVFPFIDREEESFWTAHYFEPPPKGTAADLCCECITCNARRDFKPAAPTGTFRQYKLTHKKGGFVGRKHKGVWVDGGFRPIFFREELPAHLHKQTELKRYDELPEDILQYAVKADDPRVILDVVK